MNYKSFFQNHTERVIASISWKLCQEDTPETENKVPTGGIPDCCHVTQKGSAILGILENTTHVSNRHQSDFAAAPWLQASSLNHTS